MTQSFEYMEGLICLFVSLVVAAKSKDMWKSISD